MMLVRRRRRMMMPRLQRRRSNVMIEMLIYLTPIVITIYISPLLKVTVYL